MQGNKTFKGMQNENADLKQDYQNLMRDFVEVCKSERKANELIQNLVSEFLMPKIRTEGFEPMPSLGAKVSVESDIFWHGKYKEACDQITKLLKQNGFAMIDLSAEIEYRQKAEAENLVLKCKIKELEAENECKGRQIVQWYGECIKMQDEKIASLNESKGIFLVHECEGNKGTSRQIAYYAKESDADEFAKDMSLKKENDEKTYKVFKQISVFAKPIK